TRSDRDWSSDVCSSDLEASVRVAQRLLDLVRPRAAREDEPEISPAFRQRLERLADMDSDRDVFDALHATRLIRAADRAQGARARSEDTRLNSSHDQISY